MSFEVIPAIDLRNGRCVRLQQGDFERETVFEDDPVAVARRWADAGARRIHLVDLDGARDGNRANRDAIVAITAALAGRGVVIDLGGGLRSVADVEAALSDGVGIAVLGTVAVTEPAVLAEAVQRFPGQISAGIDAREGRVAVSGWGQVTDRDAFELADEVAAAGVREVIVTDIGHDGMLAGPNLVQVHRYVDRLQIPVIASGGVASVGDIVALQERGAAGVIVGRALYTGAVDLAAALAAVA